VLEGQIYMPPEFLTGHAALDEVDAPGGPQLTSRQHEVLGLMLTARSNKEISVTLNLSDETVKNHVSAVLRAFGVQTRMQAVLAATLRGYSKAQTL